MVAACRSCYAWGREAKGVGAVCCGRAIRRKDAIHLKVVREERKKIERELLESVREVYLKLEEERPLRLEPNIDRAGIIRSRIFKPTLEEGWSMSLWEKHIACEKTRLLRRVMEEEGLKEKRAPLLLLEEGKREEEERSIREAYLKLEKEHPMELQPNKAMVRRARMNVYRLSRHDVSWSDRWEKYVAYRKTMTQRRVTLEEEAKQGRESEPWEEEELKVWCPHPFVYDKYLWETEPVCEHCRAWFGGCFNNRSQQDDQMVVEAEQEARKRDFREDTNEFEISLTRRDAKWREERKEMNRKLRAKVAEEKKEKVALEKARKREAKEEAKVRKKEEVRLARKAAYEAGRESREMAKEAKKEETKKRREAAKEAAKEARAKAAEEKKEETKKRREAAISVRKEAAKEARAETAKEKKEETKKRREAAKEAVKEARREVARVKKEETKKRREIARKTAKEARAETVRKGEEEASDRASKMEVLRILGLV